MGKAADIDEMRVRPVQSRHNLARLNIIQREIMLEAYVRTWVRACAYARTPCLTR